MKIYVDSEKDKLDLLQASEYLHNLKDIDSDLTMVNTLMHLNFNPDMIVIQEPPDPQKTLDEIIKNTMLLRRY